jgi:hypothetical protein
MKERGFYPLLLSKGQGVRVVLIMTANSLNYDFYDYYDLQDEELKVSAHENTVPPSLIVNPCS